MPLTTKIRIDPGKHLAHQLRVHSFLPDFELEDVWHIPVELMSHHSLHLFMDQFANASTQVQHNGLAGMLFKIRLFIGNTLGWDDRQLHDRLIPGSLRFRYAREENLSFKQLPDPGTGVFTPVYQLENEFLSEIENKTVHAALHFSRIPRTEKTWSIYMAVYVKPKGLFGKLYMKIIKPFRLWIVYPAIMKVACKKWRNYLENAT